MTGLQLEPEKLQRLMDILGLDEVHAKVYLGLLTIGSGTLGQISNISGVDILQTRQILDDLMKENFGARVATKTSVARFVAQEPFLRAFATSYDSLTIANLRQHLLERIEKEQALLDTEMFQKYLEKELQKLKEDSLLKANDLIKEELRDYFDKAMQEVVKLGSLTVKDANQRAAKVMTSIAKSIDQTVTLFIANIQESREKLNFIEAISHSSNLSAEFNTDIVVGESSVILLIRDLIERAKTSLFVALPDPKAIQPLVLLGKAIKEKPHLRVTVIGKLADSPKTILQKLIDTSARVKDSNETDFWAVVRDSEELLFAPQQKSPDVAMIGLISQNEALISLINNQMQSFSMKAKDIK